MVTPEKIVSSGRLPAGIPFRRTLPKRKRKVENPRRSSTHTPASMNAKQKRIHARMLRSEAAMHERKRAKSRAEVAVAL